MSLDNIRAVARRSTPAEIAEGMVAYQKYHYLTYAIAKKHGLPGHIGAGVFSALSPNNDYHGNLRDTNTVLAALVEGRSIDQFKVSTYSTNKLKAWRIANGKRPLDVIGGLKTRSFYRNVVDPKDPKPVTIDGHMHNVWFGRRIPLNDMKIRNPRGWYEKIADGIRRHAAMEGILPNQAQATLWYTWRRIHGIFTDGQLQLWSREHAAAGLGWVVPSS